MCVCVHAPLGCGRRRRRLSEMQQAGHGCLSSRLPSARPAPAPRQERERDPRRENGGLRSQHCNLRPLPSEAETQPPSQILSRRVSALQASQRRSPTLTTASPAQEEGWEWGRGAPQGLFLPTFTPSFSKTSVLLAWCPGWVRGEGCPGEGWVCKCTHPEGEREADALDRQASAGPGGVLTQRDR